MDAIQQQAFDCVSNNANIGGIFITGSGGTGKSYLIKQLKQFYEDRSLETGTANRCIVSSTTHLSAAEIGGHTINSVTGLGLISDKSLDQIAELAKKRWTQNRWRDIECLILDEVSLLHGESFAKIVHFLQLVTTLKVNGKISKYMSTLITNEKKYGASIESGRGGRGKKTKQQSNKCDVSERPNFKLVVFGDFLQIPPVVKTRDKNNRFAFEHPIWNQVIQKTFYLQKNFRQDLTLAPVVAAPPPPNIDFKTLSINTESNTLNQTKNIDVSQDRFRELIARVRTGQQTADDVALLQQRNGALLELPPVNVMSTVESVRKFNHDRLEDNPSKFVFVYRALTGYSKHINKPVSLSKRQQNGDSVPNGATFHKQKKRTVRRAAEQKKLIKTLKTESATTVCSNFDAIFDDRDYTFPNDGTKGLWKTRASKINEISRMESVLMLKLGTEVLLIENLSMHPQDGLYNGARGIVVGFSRAGTNDEYTTDQQLADALGLTIDAVNLQKESTSIDCNLSATDCLFPIVKFYKRTAALLAKSANDRSKDAKHNAQRVTDVPDVANDQDRDDELSKIPGLIDVRPQIKEDPIDFLQPALHNNLWELPHEPFSDLSDDKFHELMIKQKMPKMFFSQLPLLIGYAITAHRIQGMTLESLKANCENLFEEAMFYVIASRVRKYQDLSFENFTPDCIKTSQSAVSFYENLANVKQANVTHTNVNHANVNSIHSATPTRASLLETSSNVTQVNQPNLSKTVALASLFNLTESAKHIDTKRAIGKHNREPMSANDSQSNKKQKLNSTATATLSNLISL